MLYCLTKRYLIFSSDGVDKGKSLGTKSNSSYFHDFGIEVAATVTGLCNKPAQKLERTPVGRLFETSNMSIVSSIGDARPITAVAGAGFQSTINGRPRFDEGNKSNFKRTKGSNAIPQDVAKKTEKEIHRLIEESAKYVQKKEIFPGLEKAKEAGKKDKSLAKYRKVHSLSDQHNQELTFAVFFHLADMYRKNGMNDEALETYSFLMKQNSSKFSIVRIRVNMGNLYYFRNRYSQAIKMYQMALDHIPREEKKLSVKILRNIGNSFVKLGKLRDAVLNYESAMGLFQDIKTCFNLLLCYVQIGDIEKSKRVLLKMVSISNYRKSNEDVNLLDERNVFQKEIVEDALSQETDRRQKVIELLLCRAGRLVTMMYKINNSTEGFTWVWDVFKDKYLNIAHQIEIEQATHHLKQSEYSAAIKILKAYESKDAEATDMAAINLGFIYFLEGDYATADNYADLALRSNRYNPNALVNKGNSFFVQGDFLKAKDMYLEAIGVEANCAEAMYNLGIADMRLGIPEEALHAFEKLHTIIPNNPQVLFQVASVYDQQENIHSAIKWFNLLSTCVPSDPGILSRLGHIFSKDGDDSQSYHFHLESHRYFPSNLDVIGWLGVWFVKHEMYEKSKIFFENAVQIQPNEVKWQLMVASCHRKMGQDDRAFKEYINIRQNYPNNIECLRYLIELCKQSGRPFENYGNDLLLLEKSMDLGVVSTQSRETPYNADMILQSSVNTNTRLVGKYRDGYGSDDCFTEVDVNDLLV